MLRRNILVVHSGGLGDFVLTWPVAMGLARTFPQSRIVYVTQRQKGLLAERAIRVESTDIEAGWHTLFAEGGEVSVGIAKLLAGARTVYTFLPVSPTWIANVERLSPGCRVVTIEPPPRSGFEGHATDEIIKRLADLPVEREATKQMLRSIMDRGIGSADGGSSTVLIHPGSGSAAKNWPVDKFVQVVDRLRAAGRTVRIVVGETELEEFAPADLARLEAVRPNSLVELFDLIRSSGTFVGNDSGPGHLAAVIGRPTVTLIDHDNAARWRPIGPRVTVLTASPVTEIAVDAVVASIR